MKDVTEYRDKWLLFTEDSRLRTVANRHMDAYVDIISDRESYFDQEGQSSREFQESLAEEHLVQARETLESLRETQDKMETIKPFLKDAFIRTEDVTGRQVMYEDTAMRLVSLEQGLDLEEHETWPEMKNKLDTPSQYSSLVPSQGFPEKAFEEYSSPGDYR